MPKISVIVPVHNAEKYLDQSIGSLVAQTLNDIEIICVDDASTDNSLDKLNEYANKDKRVKVYHHTVSKSALGARKTGVMAANGEYIMFLDADDYYETDACEIAYNKIVEKNVDIVHFDLNIINVGNSPENMVESIKNAVVPYNGLLQGKDVFLGCFKDRKYAPTPCNKIYKTDICKKAYKKTADEHILFAEDLYAYFIISCYAKSYYGWNSKPLYNYCYGRGISGGASFTLKKHKQICQHATVYRLLNEFCENEGYTSEEYKFVLDRYKEEWINDIIGIWKGYLSKQDKPEGLKSMYDAWGVNNIISQLAKRFWSSRTELASYVGKIPIKPLEERNIKTIAIYYYCYSVGGVERVLSLLMPKFIEMGYKVVFITDKQPSENDFILPEGVERCVIFDKDLVTADNYHLRADAWEKIIKKHNIDMVMYSFWRSHLYLFDVMLLKGMDLPVIVQAHGVFSLAISELHKNFSEHTKTFALSDGMTVLSDVDKMFWETYVDRVYKIPNPVSKDLFDAKCSSWSNKSIVWIGRVSHEKNPDAPFEIMKRVKVKAPNAKLYLLGDFEGKEWQEKAKQLEIEDNIAFTGFVSNVNEYLEKASIHLMTSSFEGFPMALLEAKSHGIPTVMFNMPHLDLGKKECGTVGVDMFDYDSAAEEIVKLLFDENYWSEKSNLCLKNVETLKNYNYEKAWSDVIKGVEPEKYHNELTDKFVKTVVNHYDIGAKTVLSEKLRKGKRSVTDLAVSAVKCCKEKGFVYTLKLFFNRV